jgi:REP element-mobilizing transposase RayT
MKTMSRPLRIIYDGAWYHVMNRGRRGEDIFPEAGDFKVFIDLLQESCRMWKIKISAYCLMSNHYHLLLQTPQSNLSRCMRHINGIYTQRYNRLYRNDGQLFRGRYKAIVVDADSYLLELVRYIHRNPIRANIVKNVDDYKWSSHKGYLSKSKEWNWLNKDFVLEMLGPNKSRQLSSYKRFISMDDSNEIEQFFKKKNIPSILGDDSFVDNIKEKYFKEKQHMEVPESKILSPDINRIKQVVCSKYRANPEDLIVSKRGETNEARNAAIYLIRQYTGEKLMRIGREFNISKYSTVSSVILKMGNELQKDKKLKKRINDIEKLLVKGQRQT